MCLSTYRQIECLNNCTLSLEYLKMKTKVLNREMENCRLFVEGLVSSLSKNRKAIIQTGDKTVFVKTDEISENKCSATERFMVSIVNSQKLKIANLTNTYNEILIMMNTIQLFTKVIVTWVEISIEYTYRWQILLLRLGTLIVK